MTVFVRASIMLVLFFTSTAAFSQQTDGDELELIRQMNQGESGMATVVGFDKRYEGTKGSPYLFDEWLTGSIKSRIGKTFNNVSLKFDAYANQLYLKGKDEKSPMLLNKTDVAEFTINNLTGFTSSTFRVVDEGEGVFTYVEVLFESKIMVYKKVGKRLQKANIRADSYGSGNNFDQFVDTESIVVIENEERIEFKRTKSSFFRAFPKHKSTLRKFIKKQNLDLDKDPDLVKIFGYYESLL